MSAAIGAGVGAGLGAVTSIIGLRSANKQAIGNIKNEANVLHSQLKQININREQLDRELGDVLSSTALETAKNMATAKVLMSTSGTVGGTTAQVSKQAYMEQILADADSIAQARNSERGMLMDAISKRIQFKQRSDVYRSQIASPLSAFIGTVSSMVSGATQGAQMGIGIEGMMGTGASMVPSTAIPYIGTTPEARMSARNLNFSNYLQAQG